MYRYLMWTTLAVWLVLSLAADAQAGRRRLGAWRRTPHASYRPAARHQARRRRAPRPSGDPYGFYNPGNWYSKYYAGFHSRYFSEIGIPTGDRGIRGTAW